MATIRPSSRVKDRLTLIIDSSLKQHEAWLCYSIFAPIITGFLGILLYLTSTATSDNLLHIYLALAAMTSACWWLWTMYVLYKMFLAQRHVIEMTTEVLSEIKEIKSSVLEDNQLTSIK